MSEKGKNTAAKAGVGYTVGNVLVKGINFISLPIFSRIMTTDQFGIYNVFVMDETHTIIGCGAGAVTKLKVPGSTSLSRIFNYKYPYEYINGFDEMLKRKDQVKQFYDELS